MGYALQYAPMQQLLFITLIKLQNLACKIVQITILKMILQEDVYFWVVVVTGTMQITLKENALFNVTPHSSSIKIANQCNVSLNVLSGNLEFIKILVLSIVM